MSRVVSFFAALVCAVLLAAPVQAGAVTTAVALIANGVSFGAALTASFGAFGAFLIKAAVGIVFNVAAQMLSAPKQKVRVNGIQTEQTTTGDVTPQKIIVGRYATEGHLVAPAYTHGPLNGKLTYIIELSNAPIEGLTGRIAVDGAWYDIEDDPGEEHADYGWPIKGLERKLDNTTAAWIKWYDGTQTTADAMLVDKYGSHPDRPWTTDHILKGTAYAIMTFQYAEGVFSSLPTVRFEVDGMPLYDPRKDTTVGGSGTHRWNDSSTWEFTRNPQVINYNILRGITLPTGDIYGGQVPEDDLPLDDWFAAMNECDVDVDGRPQFTAGFEIDVTAQPQEIITELNKASFTQLSQFGGVFRPRTGAPAASVLSITDDDLLVTKSGELTPFPDLASTYNEITGTYVEPASLYQGTQIDPIRSSEWETADGDRRLSLDMGLPAVTDVSQATHLLTSYINDERRFVTHRVPLSPVAGLIEPLDTISWTSAQNGYTDKLFEVVAVEDAIDTGVIMLTIRERDPDDTDTTDAVTPPDDLVADTEPTAITPTLTAAAQVVQDDSGNDRRPGIKLSWPTSEAEDIELIRYEVRLPTSEAIVASGTVDAAGGETVVTQGLVAGEPYEARAKYLTGAYPADWSDWKSATAPSVLIDRDDLADGAVTDRVEDSITGIVQRGATPDPVVLMTISLGAISYNEVWNFNGSGFVVTGSTVGVLNCYRRVKFLGVWSSWTKVDRSFNSSVATGWNYWNFFEAISGVFDDVEYKMEATWGAPPIGVENSHARCQISAERARR